jgi:GntR family transcriptional regulator / MocR family aminotransferase
MQDQIVGYFRDAVLSRRLKGGVRVPSSRVLAADHDVARITVVEAYDRLVAEAFSRAGPARASSSPRPKSSPRSAWSRARPDVSGSACPSCAEVPDQVALPRRSRARPDGKSELVADQGRRTPMDRATT